MQTLAILVCALVVYAIISEIRLGLWVKYIYELEDRIEDLEKKQRLSTEYDKLSTC